MGVERDGLKATTGLALDWLKLRPLVPALSAFIAGILFSSRAGLSIRHLLVSLIISLAMSVGFLLLKRKGASILALLSFFLLGALFITPYARPEINSNHILHHVQESGGKGAIIEGIVRGMPERTPEAVRFYLDLFRAAQKGKTPRQTSGRVRLTVRIVEDKLSDASKSFEIGPGDRVRISANLSRPRNLSNPGGFDYEWWLGRRGALVTGYARDVTQVKILEPGRGAGKFIWEIKERVEREISDTGLKHSAVITALVTGARGEITAEIEEAFRRTGTTHILSISGLHVGVVAWVFYALTLTILRRLESLMLVVNVKKLSIALALGPVFFYGALSGFSVSTERAVIMVTAFVLIQLMGRGRDILSAVALAAFIILLASPWALWEPSFQLSFLAVIGIVSIAPALEKLLKREPDPLSALTPKGRFGAATDRALRYITALFLVSLSASIATAPITAYHFNGLSLFGLVANVVAVPLMGFAAVVLSLAGAAFIVIGPAPAYTAFALADVMIDMAARAVVFISAFDQSFVWAARPSFVFIFIFYLFILSALVTLRAKIPAYTLLILISLTGSAIGATFIYQRGFRSTNELKATFLSVGQSEATLVEFPTGETMLIDGGGSMGEDFDIGERVVSPFLRNKGIDRIDYLVLSHAQRDHMGGFSYIAGNFEIGEFWWPGIGDLKALGRVLKRNEIKTYVMGSATKRRNIGNAFVEFLNPVPGDVSDINDASLAFKLVYGKRALLFTGDIGKKTEIALSKEHGKTIRADVLKAPHHGSRYSSSQEFLEEVKPSIVAISAGHGNGFGFPHAETLGRYGVAGAKIYRTDLDGAITIKTDGETIEAQTHLTGGKSRSILKVMDYNESTTFGNKTP